MKNTLSDQLETARGVACHTASSRLVRLPPPVPAGVADTGRIRFGAGVRLPTPRPGA
ncbi:MAG: hypothetical protein JOY66_10605 [Acetobacteraceae bacterium]|nr:hypothetical protein [Acetobacteraceae bacterium]